jgi:hypothetical protein
MILGLALGHVVIKSARHVIARNGRNVFRTNDAVNLTAF